MRKNFFVLVAVMAFMVESLPLNFKSLDSSPDVIPESESHSNIQIQPRAEVFPMFFEKPHHKEDTPEKPLVTPSLELHLFPKIFGTTKAALVPETTEAAPVPKTTEAPPKIEEKIKQDPKRKSPFLLKFFPKPQNDAAAGRPEGGSGVRETEMTVSIPRFKTDSMGKWVYNPWGVTYADTWKLTNVLGNNFIWDWNSQSNYKTQDPHPTVCDARSTVYNVPAIMDWIVRKDRYSSKSRRPLWPDLRMEIYLQGKSEICHTNQYVDLRPFVECEILRNMRMEYLVPMYPLHQLGNMFYT